MVAFLHIPETVAMHPLSPEKSLDLKLARIVADPACRDFILADAKDADMAFGLAAPGLAAGGNAGTGPFRSIGEYRDQIREIVRERLVDIMLMSASTSEVLAIEEGLFISRSLRSMTALERTLGRTKFQEILGDLLGRSVGSFSLVPDEESQTTSLPFKPLQIKEYS
jgi:hypothetical protein